MPECPKCGHWLASRTEYNHGLHIWEPVLYCIHGCCLINQPLVDRNWKQRDVAAEGRWAKQRAKNVGKTFVCKTCGQEFVSDGNFIRSCRVCMNKKRSEARKGRKFARNGVYMGRGILGYRGESKRAATGQERALEGQKEIQP